VEIGKIKMHVKGMQNYFTTNFTLPMNITIEKMGLNKTVNIINNLSQSQANLKINGLIKACRGDATRDGNVDIDDGALIYRYKLNPTYFPSLYVNLTDISDCLDINGDGNVDIDDGALIYRYKLNPTYFPSLYVNITSY